MEKQIKKRCIDCKKMLSMDSFTGRPNYSKSGIAYKRPMCRKCASIRAKAWRDANTERYNEYHRDYYKKNKEVLLKKRKYSITEK